MYSILGALAPSPKLIQKKRYENSAKVARSILFYHGYVLLLGVILKICPKCHEKTSTKKWKFFVW